MSNQVAEIRLQYIQKVTKLQAKLLIVPSDSIQVSRILRAIQILAARTERKIARCVMSPIAILRDAHLRIGKKYDERIYKLTLLEMGEQQSGSLRYAQRIHAIIEGLQYDRSLEMRLAREVYNADCEQFRGDNNREPDGIH